MFDPTSRFNVADSHQNPGFMHKLLSFLNKMSSRSMAEWCLVQPGVHGAQRIIVHPQRRPVPAEPGPFWERLEAHALWRPGAFRVKGRALGGGVPESLAGSNRNVKWSILHC